MTPLPRLAWYHRAGPDPKRPGPLGCLLEGRFHDLEGILGDLAYDARACLAEGCLRASKLEELARLSGEGSPEPPAEGFGLPIPEPGKVLCLGKNYAAHAAEFGAEPPKEPMWFNKLPEALIPAGRPIPLPPSLGRVDHEGELVLVLGASGKDLDEEEAVALVAGLTIGNDVTARDMQQRDRERGHPWVRCKSFDGFGPVGPWVVPFEEFFGADGPPADGTPDLEIEVRVDGEVRQHSRTGSMLHRIAQAVAWFSRHTTLRPGDLCFTGTPEGVSPLNPGSCVEVSIEGIGTLANPVVEA